MTSHDHKAHDCLRASARIKTAAAALAVIAGLHAAPASAATLAESVDVNASPAAVWALIGPYCAIANWLPPIGTCRLEGEGSSVRTLVTRDNGATFVEREVARDDARYFYSYAFVSSPLPVHDYLSTIRVTARGMGGSTVTWTGEYKPDHGQEKVARDALTGVYRAGLETIASRFAH